MMKPKVASLGFSKEELESAAESIAGNLTDESSEDDINAQIDAVIPFLKLGQKMATRAINASKNPESEEAKKQAEEEARKKAEEEAKASEESKKNPQPTDFAKIVADAVSAAVKPLQEKLTAFETGERSKSYVAGLKERLKDIDEDFYSLQLEGKTFGSDDEVGDFATKVESKWKAFTEKHAKEGLSFSVPGSSKNNVGKGDDIDSLVNSIEKGTKDKVEQQKQQQ